MIFFYWDVSIIFFIFLGDGIFDRLDNDQIINKIWSSKKLGQTITDIHSFCGKITDAIIGEREGKGKHFLKRFSEKIASDEKQADKTA